VGTNLINLVLVDDLDFPPTLIHLDFRIGTRHLISYLNPLESIGINQVALNLQFNQLNIPATLNVLRMKCYLILLRNFTA